MIGCSLAILKELFIIIWRWIIKAMSENQTLSMQNNATENNNLMQES
jgi:hypothetical protein